VTPEETLVAWFPQLKATKFEVSSDPDPRYNCIACAAGSSTCWWWPSRVELPGQCWPRRVPPTRTVESFRLAFESLGYREVEVLSDDPSQEQVAVFIDASGRPTHAAYRAAPAEQWISKLGRAWDIQHEELESVGGHTNQGYGDPAILLERPNPILTLRDPLLH
jgi:hypothetical protein